MSAGRACAAKAGWPLERVLFALAGTVTLVSALLTALVSRWFLLLSVFVGINQWLYVTVGVCPASLALTRLFRLRSLVYPKERVKWAWRLPRPLHRVLPDVRSGHA